MSTPQEKNFEDYKRAERKALEILKEMKGVSAKPSDIELALLVAVFELHKGSMDAGHIAKIIEGHLNQLVPFYNRGPDSN
ncbi:hypothetical protein [Pelagicoccus sp. SDUM812003]|uniref:hypothetical protein n=1 Tax=Pelagicoccus sp. SDUM812003 TaxID=3041267 RepID=UPI00280D0AB9|nr:hypothetical protein [Pelagicoccus sp. SDUM812003]MDQ8205383.1 hypothetical protein [Pelagicoccus sp. SDUM812003]